MPSPKTLTRIRNNIIEVLLRLDKEVREYHYTTEDFARRINAIDTILTKATDDFGSDFVAETVFEVVQRIDQPLDLNNDVIRSLHSRGCSLVGVVSMYKWVKEDPIKAMGFNV